MEISYDSICNNNIWFSSEQRTVKPNMTLPWLQNWKRLQSTGQKMVTIDWYLLIDEVWIRKPKVTQISWLPGAGFSKLFQNPYLHPKQLKHFTRILALHTVSSHCKNISECKQCKQLSGVLHSGHGLSVAFGLFNSDLVHTTYAIYVTHILQWFVAIKYSFPQTTWHWGPIRCHGILLGNRHWLNNGRVNNDAAQHWEVSQILCENETLQSYK